MCAMTMSPFIDVLSLDYNPPCFLRDGHSQTIFPSLARKVRGVFYQRERIELEDGDFLDLDWSRPTSIDDSTDTQRNASAVRRLVILCHGLEGNSNRPYMRGMVRAVNWTGWDALAWNYRGCSGETNRLLRFYHNGATDDLERVIQHAIKGAQYDQIALVGFSLGGNLVLNYLSWHRSELPRQVFKAIVFSVPLHIESSAVALARFANRIYMRRFLNELHQKVRAKEKMFPSEISSDEYGDIKDFQGFDDRYTAPIHGFDDAMAYWTKCSGAWAIPHVTVPTLIVNAQNDPFLTPQCFPTQEILQTENVALLSPAHGGHCGFPQFGTQGMYWSERVAQIFLK